jgi:outer membrane protein assembly factor BamB
MFRVRTTSSRALLPMLVLCVVIVAPVAGDARSDPPQVFPSDPLWTIAFSETPVGTPAAGGNRLFVPLQSAISARSLASNAELWRAKIVADGPIVATADRVLVPSKGALTALDAATGREIWKVPVEGLSAPVVVHGDLVFVAAAEQLSAYTLADGAAAWMTKPIGTIERRVTASENWVYVPLADGRIMALDSSTGARIWETDEIGIKPSEPLVAGDRVFAGSEAKHFCSFRLTDGYKEWCHTVGAAIVGQAAADARRVYFVALDNQMWSLERRNGGRQWKRALNYRPSAGPTIVGQTISAPGKTEKLVAFDVATGQPTGQELVLSEPLVAPTVFVPASEGVAVRVAVMFGSLVNEWKLMLAGPPPATLPSMKVEALTALPGRVVPLAAGRSPRE